MDAPEADAPAAAPAPAAPAPPAPEPAGEPEVPVVKPLTPVSALRPGTSGHDLVVKVVEVKPPVSIARPDGSSASIVEALVADGTAAVVLTSHNAQAELMKVGNVLLLSNAKVNMFQGTPRLALDRSGTMQLAAEGTEVEAQTELNMSLIEYDLVTA